MITDINSMWKELRQRIETCQFCELCNTRAKAVFGEGPIHSKVVVIGEAPGNQENLEGRPFVGPAGNLLTGILENGGGIARNSVYITNIVKCWPPPEDKTKKNGQPDNKQISTCINFLEAQLFLLQPKIIVTMGNIATKALLKSGEGITNLRGTWHNWRGIKLLPMLHPSYLLRQRDAKELKILKLKTWNDVYSLRQAIKALGISKEMLVDDDDEKFKPPQTFSDNS